MAAMQPGIDQLPNSNKDFYTIERYLQLQGRQGTVSLCSPDVPLFSLYGINVEKYLEELPESNGHIYAYAMNNYWYTNYRFWQEGPVRFRFSLRYDDQKASPSVSDRFALECSRPLLTVLTGQQQEGVLDRDVFSLAGISTGNAYIQSIKKAENGKGWIVRLNETDGSGGLCTLIFDPKVQLTRAWETDMVENMQNELSVHNNSLELNLQPYEAKTLWLWFSGD